MDRRKKHLFLPTMLRRSEHADFTEVAKPIFVRGFSVHRRGRGKFWQGDPVKTTLGGLRPGSGARSLCAVSAAARGAGSGPAAGRAGIEHYFQLSDGPKSGSSFCRGVAKRPPIFHE